MAPRSNMALICLMAGDVVDLSPVTVWRIVPGTVRCLLARANCFSVAEDGAARQHRSL